MKTKLLITSLILGITGAAHADIDTSDMPFQYPDRCKEKFSIVLPSSQEGTSYYFNRDCSVAYIVPPGTGSLIVSKPAYKFGIRLCPAVAKNAVSINSMMSQIAQLNEQAAKPTVSIEKKKEILEMTTNLRDLVKGMSSDFSSTPAMTVQMSFKTSLTPKYMDAIQIANLPLIQTQKLIIKPAPLEKSYLSFNLVTPGATNVYHDNPVLESNISGILSKADEGQNSRSSVNFEGNAEGWVTLSATGACDLVSGDYSNPSELKLDTERAANYLTVTNTMMVPLASSFGYKASMNVANATEVLFSKYGNNSQFTSSELTTVLLQGMTSDSFSVTSWTAENLSGTLETQLESAISPDNLVLIKNAMVSEYASKLVEMKALGIITPLATPQAGNATETGVRRECHSSSSWFGLSSDSSCTDVTYQFLVPQDGRLDQKATILNQLSAQFSQSVEIFHPVSRVYTTNFKVSGGLK